jgi:hypothetical protein
MSFMVFDRRESQSKTARRCRAKSESIAASGDPAMAYATSALGDHCRPASAIRTVLSFADK